MTTKIIKEEPVKEWWKFYLQKENWPIQAVTIRDYNEIYAVIEHLNKD